MSEDHLLERIGAARGFLSANGGGVSPTVAIWPWLWKGSFEQRGTNWTVESAELRMGRSLRRELEGTPLFQLEFSRGHDGQGGTYYIYRGVIGFAANGRVFVSFEKIYIGQKNGSEWRGSTAKGDNGTLSGTWFFHYYDRRAGTSGPFSGGWELKVGQ
jgi:hypothetical protein